jgi:phage shock protein A
MSEYAEFNDQVATFAPVRNLGAEVQELEAQRRQLQRDNAELREKLAELEAKLNAAIVAAVYQGVQHAGA